MTLTKLLCKSVDFQYMKNNSLRALGNTAEIDGHSKEVIVVLLADDDIISNYTLRDMTESTGKYKIIPCFNGVEASNTFEEKHGEIHIIILDLEMPERNGIETALWIRSFEKGLGGKKGTPIIGLTGHDDEEIKKSCLDAGMNMVLTKPINMKNLLAHLNKFSA
jgi:two-component system sensor histidine kinase RpfC